MFDSVARGEASDLNLLYTIAETNPDIHLVMLGTMGGEFGRPNIDIDIDIEEGWLDLDHDGRTGRVLFLERPQVHRTARPRPGAAPALEHPDRVAVRDHQAVRPPRTPRGAAADGEMARAHRLSADPNRTRVIRPYGECHLGPE